MAVSLPSIAANAVGNLAHIVLKARFSEPNPWIAKYLFFNLYIALEGHALYKSIK